MRPLNHRWSSARRDYLTPAGHRQEAERLAWVIDEEIQSGAERTMGDLIALARLHLELAREEGPGERSG